MARVLIIGSGGREHALAWKMANSTLAETVFVAPGNAGTAMEPGVENVDIAAGDFERLAAFCRNEKIDFSVVGPERPLVQGIVDYFQQRQLDCFGPSAAAAHLEGSKSFCKAFLSRHAIPTAQHASFDDLASALDYVQKHPLPVVVKADGLAAGKGVVIARTRQGAIRSVEDMIGKGVFGEAGRRVVIEEFLEGEEASFMVMCDGANVLPLATSQDHKARDEGDKGPNTGGMGAYSPAPIITAERFDQIMDTIIYPTVRGLAQEGRSYTGFLYAGLMIGATSIKVLEYNCRLGDPETQPIVMRLRSDLLRLCRSALDKKLDREQAQWSKKKALGVVMATRGYPGSCASGSIITGLNSVSGCKIFHAGTSVNGDGQVVTSSGRVLCLTALEETLANARSKALADATGISWGAEFYRRDIGRRVLEPGTE